MVAAATSAASASSSALRFEVEGLELAGPGPVVIMMRHASIIDNVAARRCSSHAHGIGLRFVIKRELQMIPTIDIGGRWVPTHLRPPRLGRQRRRGRGAAQPARTGSAPDEGILIYPEGTRSTTAKLARAQEIIAERQPEIAPLANRLAATSCRRASAARSRCSTRRRTSTSSSAATPASTASQHISDIWAGGLVGTTISLRFWRYAAAEIPADDEARAAWLYERWQELDDWVGEQRRLEHEEGVVSGRRSGVRTPTPGIRCGDETRSTCPPTPDRSPAPAPDPPPPFPDPGPATPERDPRRRASRRSSRLAGAPHARARADIGSWP